MTDKTTATRPPLRAVVVELPAQRTLRPEHLEQLRASGLTDETIELAQLYTEAARQRLADMMDRKGWSHGAAIVFPFYLPGADTPHAYRIRPTTPRIEKRGKKERLVKYDQASSAGQLVYFPPRARLDNGYTDLTRPVVWTEGEKKCLALDQLGYVVVGLCGVWNWGDKKYRKETGGERLYPLIAQHVPIAGREHVIVFDADSRDNDNVMLAAQRLAWHLVAGGATRVTFTCPPDVTTAKGIDDYYAAHGEPAVRSLIGSAQHIEPANPRQPLQHVRQLAALRDSPLPEWLRIPATYEVTKDGALWTDDKRVTGQPIFITRQLYHLVDGDERVELMYPAGEDDWRMLRATRKAVCDTRTMVAELAPLGVPVTSVNASRVVEWLDALAEANRGRTPRVACVDSTGWHRVDGADVFMLDAPIGAAADRMTLDARGDTAGIFRALTPRGSHTAQLDALGRAWNADPVAAIVIAASFAAPLLQPLGVSNFGVHMPGESSRGKTSMLRIAASVYGDPLDQQWCATWNATASGVEARAARLNHLPQCYDEVGAGSDAKSTERQVYALINGSGKVRSGRDLGARSVRAWRTIVISAGERELTDESASTGAQVRCIQLPVGGFGKLTGDEVDALRSACIDNAGNAGRAWLEQLVETDAEGWQTFRELHAHMARELSASTADTLQRRVAGYFATLAVCEVILATELGIGDDSGATMRRAFLGNGSGHERERLDGVADRARELIEALVYSEPDAFPIQRPDGSESSSHGTRRLGFRKGDDVYFVKTLFDEFMRKHGIEPRVVVREWLDRGETVVDGDGHLSKKVKDYPRCVILLAPTKVGQRC